MRGAVEAIEAGAARVLVVAYFDRLVRSLVVQAEVVGRIERAGGRVAAVDFGEITDRTAAQWISATTLGMVSEYYRRSIKERSGAAQAEAVARGVVPFPSIPPGYQRRADGTLEPDGNAGLVAEAFKMRAGGRALSEISAFLRENGIERNKTAVHRILASRLYLGEVHFGELVNTEAHEPIVDRATWEAAQGTRRGSVTRSDRLLARLGVLRCGTCGARMIASTQVQGGITYPYYRCPTNNTCPRRVTVSAQKVEAFAVEQTQLALKGMEGRASADQEARDAEAALEKAQGDLDAAVRAFQGLAGEASATERLRELRDVRDAASLAVDHLSRLHSALTVSVEDWGVLTLDEQRDLIRATIERIEVAPGRGDRRLTAKLLREDAPGGAV